MASSRLKILVLVVLLLIVAIVTARSGRRVSQLRTSDRVYKALSERDWARALQLSQGATGADEAGRSIAEARCLAFLATGRATECSELFDENYVPREETKIRQRGARR